MARMNPSAAMVVVLLVLSACDSEQSSAQQSSNVTDVEVEAAHQLLSGDEPPIVLDVGRRGPIDRPPLFSNSNGDASNQHPPADNEAGITFLD